MLEAFNISLSFDKPVLKNINFFLSQVQRSASSSFGVPGLNQAMSSVRHLGDAEGSTLLSQLEFPISPRATPSAPSEARFRVEKFCRPRSLVHVLTCCLGAWQKMQGPERLNSGPCTRVTTSPTASLQPDTPGMLWPPRSYERR